MKIVATYNIKGGVGKTATAVNIAWLAARDGLRTVIWDLDPQAAATFYFRIEAGVRGGVERLVEKKDALAEAVHATDYERLDLIPADFSYRNLDIELHGAKKPVKQLLRLIRPLSEDYDLLILDAPPSISIVSENIFRAADALLVPLIPTTLSLRTYAQLLDYFGENPDRRPLLLPFVSMADRRKRMHVDTIRQLQRDDPRVLSAVIPYSSVIERMGEQRAPVGVFAASHPAAEAYAALWHEAARRMLIERPETR
ncbi:MAG: AAA family ATPase [Chromatiales bacterium]|nr:AAA family ATPase [Chromatiales bacterium]